MKGRVQAQTRVHVQEQTLAQGLVRGLLGAQLREGLPEPWELWEGLPLPC